MPHRHDQPLRIHHVVTDVNREDAGPSYSVTRLAEELLKLGHDVHLHALEPPPQRSIGVPTHFYPRASAAPQLGMSRMMRQGLKHAALNSDIMHAHGLWMMPNVYPAWATHGTRCRLVLSPRGMLDPWALSWHSRRKWAFKAALQGRALRSVDRFHATSQDEADAIRLAGYGQGIDVIPIGIDIPPRKKTPTAAKRTVVSVGRIHPQKNLEALIEAWTEATPGDGNWTLVIAGPGDRTYVDRITELASRSKGIEVRGPVYGVEKWALLQSSEIFVLPTYSESFGVVIAEALSAGLPVIVSEGAPWAGVADRHCGLSVAPTSQALAGALGHMTSLDRSILAEMGERGRRWMAEEFAWSEVAQRTIAAYREATHE